jgi:hypothetical protein
MDNNILFYEEYYINIINNIFNNIDENYNILLFIKNEFNIYNYFSHIIKKKNIKIDIVIDNINNIFIVNKLKDDIKGEEYEENINFFLNINDIDFKIYNIIIIFQLDNNEKFENILNNINNINNITDNNSLIYIYNSLSNKRIDYKNYFRNLLNEYTNINIGNVLKLNDIIFIIKNNNFDIISMKTYRKNNYLLYGDNTIYEIIIKKDYTFINKIS